MRIILLSAMAGILLASVAIAGDCCGQPACCEKSCGSCEKMTCKVVCEMKKIKKTVWVVECEQICVANPNCHKSYCGCKACCDNGFCGEGCGEDCGGCDPCAELLSRPMVQPKCGKVRYRKKLIAKTVVCEVPTYKCIPVSCGSACGDSCGENENVAPKQEKSAIKAAPLPPRLIKAKT